VCVEAHDRIYGLDIRTGSVEWAVENFSDGSSFRYTINALAGDDELLCGTRRLDYEAPSLVAFDPSNGTVLWRGDVDPSPWPPVVGPENVYVMTTGETVHAFTRDGEREWSTDVQIVAPPAVGSDRVYATSSDRENVIAFDAGTGAEQWRAEVGQYTSHVPIATPKSIYVVSGSHDAPVTVVALDPETGEVQWEDNRPGSESILSGGPAVAPALSEEGIVVMTGGSSTPEGKQGTYLV
jgi:outer membrane protein assembly factor BamB